MKCEDYDQIYALWLSCEGMGLNDVDDSQEGIARFLKRNPETCFVAEDQGKIIGVMMSGHDGRRGYIYHTAVNEEYRGQGIGSLLVKKTLDAFCRLNISKVALVVFKRNEIGNLFWESQGFVKRNDLVYRNQALIEMERIDT